MTRHRDTTNALTHLGSGCDVEDFSPQLLVKPSLRPPKQWLRHVFPEFRLTEAEDEFAVFMQMKRNTTLGTFVSCVVLFIPVVIVRWESSSRRGSSSCDLSCVLSLASLVLWAAVVCAQMYLRHAHVQKVHLFELNKMHGQHHQDHAATASPEAFVNAALDAVLPIAPRTGSATVANAGMTSVSMFFGSATTGLNASLDPPSTMDRSVVPPLLGDADGTSNHRSPSIAASSQSAMDAVRHYLDAARTTLRKNAAAHEALCGCALLAFLGQALAFYADRGQCALGAWGTDPTVASSCVHAPQLEACILGIALLTASGLVPLRMSVLLPVSVCSSAFFLAAWWYERHAPDITPASQGILAVATLSVTLVCLALAHLNETRNREAFSSLCSIRFCIASLVSLRHYSATLVGPAIPQDVAKVVASRQELFDYSGDAAVLCLGIKDMGVIAAGSSCAEIVDFLQRFFLVVDTVKMCFPRCFKLHAFGDRYLVVAGWEQYMDEHEKEKLRAATVAAAEHALDEGSPVALGTTMPPNGQLGDRSPSVPMLIVETPSNDFTQELTQPASNPAIKARFNSECVYSLGILLTRVLEREFFERLWCAVRGVQWSGNTGRLRTEETVSVVIAADIGRAAGVLLAGTTISYAAVGDSVARCQRNLDMAVENGFYVTAEFQRALGFTVDPCMCTVLPDDRPPTAIEREIESLGVSMWNAPVLQSIGESVEVDERQRMADSSMSINANSMNVATRGTVLGPRSVVSSMVTPSQRSVREDMPSAVANPLLGAQSSSIALTNLTTNTARSDGGSKPSSGTTIMHSDGSSRSTSARILEMIHQELEENAFALERVYRIGFRFHNAEVEQQYRTLSQKPTQKRRTQFLQHFICATCASIVYLASCLIAGQSLTPLPSSAALFVLAAFVAMASVFLTLVVYTQLDDDLPLLALMGMWHVANVAGFWYAVYGEGHGKSYSFHDTQFLWMLVHVCLSRLSAPLMDCKLDMIFHAAWSVPFIALTAASRRDMPRGYIASQLVAEFAVLMVLLTSRLVKDEQSRNIFGVQQRLHQLHEALHNDVADLRKLLGRLIQNTDVVDELMAALKQGGRTLTTTLYETNPQNPLGTRCKLMTDTQMMSFLVCNAVFNSNTPMPKRNSRRAQAMHQMKPILKPMWKFYGQLEELLQQQPLGATVTVVKTNGDCMLFTSKGDAHRNASSAGSSATERHAASLGCMSMLALAEGLLYLSSSVNGVELRLVLSHGPLVGAILGSCAMSLEYYGAAAFVAYALAQRCLPRVTGTEDFVLAAGPALHDQCSLGPEQKERVGHYGFVQIHPLIMKGTTS